MSKDQYVELQKRIEKRREIAKQKRDKIEEVKPMVFRLLLMVLWAKITGVGR
jgi:hypothetical protein